MALLSLYDLENNAVRQLAPALRREGWRVVEVYFKDWRNNAFEEPASKEESDLLDVLDREQVDLVGVSLRASAYEGICAHLCELLRGRGYPVIVGGWHATVRPMDCMRFADAVCLGEADLSFPQVIRLFFQGAAWREAPGIWSRTADGGIRRNAPAVQPDDLDAVPWRDYGHPDKVVIHQGRVTWGDPMARDPVFQVMASRGCIHHCAFCHNSFESPYIGSPRRLRLRSVGAVLDEIRQARARNPAIRCIRFDDEIFGISTGWLREFAARYPSECGLRFDLMSEPGSVTESYADLLVQAGARVVHLGIQHDDEVNARSLARRSSMEQTRQAVQRLTARGIQVRFLVMVDIPDTRPEQNERLFRFLLEAPRPFDLFLFSLTLFPGSAFVEERLAAGHLDPALIEGRATKTFQQYRVDLAWPRPPEDRYWLALFLLAANPAVPRAALERIAASAVLRAHPDLLLRVAGATTLAKTSWRALEMVADGTMTVTLLHRWTAMGRWITT